MLRRDVRVGGGGSQKAVNGDAADPASSPSTIETIESAPILPVRNYFSLGEINS